MSGNRNLRLYVSTVMIIFLAIIGFKDAQVHICMGTGEPDRHWFVMPPAMTQACMRPPHTHTSLPDILQIVTPSNGRSLEYATFTMPERESCHDVRCLS